jgi:hypothetical protein
MSHWTIAYSKLNFSQEINMFKKIIQRMLILAVIFFGLIILLVGGFWLFSSQRAADPTPLVSIHSPGNGMEISLGETIAIDSTSWDEIQTITSVELWSVQGEVLTLIERASILEGKHSISLTQGWQPFSLGNYRLIVRAFNDLGNSGQAAVDLLVVEETEEEVSILGEGYLNQPEGGFVPIQPYPGGGEEEGSDPSPPPPNPNPPDPPILLPVLFDLLMELFLPFDLNGTWVEVEALAFQVQEQYDELYCYVGLGDYPPERVPEMGSFQVSNIYSWNLPDYLGGNNKAVVFVPDNESLDVYLDCVGFRQNSSLPLWPGVYKKEHPPADWTGEIIVGQNNFGDGFTISYRINPVGGPLMAPTNLNQFTFNNRILLNWTWLGNENEIDGFKIYRNNSHVATIFKTQRITEIPPWWIVPPCSEEFNYTVIAYKEDLHSAPSNYLPYQGDVCGGENGVLSLNSQLICAGTGQNFSVDYRYQSPHGAASMDLRAFKDGEIVTEILSTRVQIQHGEGSAQLAMTYHGAAPLTTDQVSVYFYDHNNMPFYVQTFDRVIEWVPGSPDLTIPSARVDRENHKLLIQIRNSGCARPAVETPMVSIVREADGWTGFLELEEDLEPRTQALLTLDLDPNEMELWGGEINLTVDPMDNVNERNENNNTYQIDAARIKHIQVYKIDIHNDHDKYSKGEWFFFAKIYEIPKGGGDWNLIYVPYREYHWGTGGHNINNLFLNPTLGADDTFALVVDGFEEDFPGNDWIGVVMVYHSPDGTQISQLENNGYQLMGSWKSGGEYSVLSDKGDYTIFYRIILE